MEEEEFELKRDLKTFEFCDDVMFLRSIYDGIYPGGPRWRHPVCFR